MSKAPSPKKSGQIHIGVGGWTFAPWRGVFYPDKLTQAKELQYAASKLTSIEINGTYYGSQKPESFRKWAREVPDGFVFSVKGPRFTTNRRVLAEAGDSIKHFYNTGVLELGDRLGPVLWQFAPTKKFDEADFGKFLELLPRKIDGRALRHVVEVRHPSFCAPAFVALLRQFETPVVFAEHGTYPAISDVAGDFVYARLQKGDDESRPAIRRSSSMPGRSGYSSGPKAANPTIFHALTSRQRRRRRATCLPMSFTRARSARRRRDGADRAREIMAKGKKLFTIGYEQTPSKAVLDELEHAGVKLLVDVRAVTSSRRPGFSKNQLAAGLDERGIGYIHLAGLGTPKEGRLAARSGDYAKLEKIFARHLKTPQAKEGIDELSALVKKAGPVCLLCYERDHEHCHRRWIAEIIEDRDKVKVENLAGKQV